MIYAYECYFNLQIHIGAPLARQESINTDGWDFPGNLLRTRTICHRYVWNLSKGPFRNSN